jgi:rhodanese-related sulfurtransferase
VAESYQKKGLTNVTALNGGVQAWKDAGFGVVAAK